MTARYLTNCQRNPGLKLLPRTVEPDSLTSSAAASPPRDHYTGKVTRPYFTGTVPHSNIIDITNVLLDDKKKTFIVDLATFFCEGNTYMWAVSEQKIRKENSRLFAEILVSPSMYQKFLQNRTLKLENFDEPFMAYLSLSPSADIVKLSLHKLPSQYRRQNGDVQPRNNMHFFN
ncbi:hypothetical protein HMPREF1544_02647 [Mucor circinelloides 1006PhL]|uniref:Uncharacterized protein n=1 Tax=Mucor circinelloides f. circinelloides (strain 1006PhL) TaxID=1220926 RepID=S2JKI3_MUCC1|nr:hypothetical protein HMPREF1544_02647 [Mucor circinelloides 1006PhL]